MTCQEVVLWGMIPLLAVLSFTYSIDTNGHVDRSKLKLLSITAAVIWAAGFAAVKGWFIWQ